MTIAEKAYELYKLDWISDNVDDEVWLNTIALWMETIDDCIKDDIEPDSLFDFIEEYGFTNDVGCYVCFDEFLDNEYEYEEYMYDLLGDMYFKEYMYFKNEDNEDEE